MVWYDYCHILHICQEFAAKKAKYQIPNNMKKDIADSFKAIEKTVTQLGKIIVEKAATPAHVKDVLARGVADYKAFSALVSKVAALLKWACLHHDDESRLRFYNV